jgi:hypothetical protein
MVYGAQTPFSDQLGFQWEGSLWEYDPQHNSLITAGNGGTKPIQASFTIYYNQGIKKYELEQTLQPDEQMWIDVGKLIREHIPDKNGNTLPADLASGTYEFRDLTDRAIGSLFEGKVIYDKTYGHVTYGCGGNCCYGDPILWDNPLGIPITSGDANFVMAPDCNSPPDQDVTAAFQTWTTANTNIATVNSTGYHTGVGVGTTSTTASGHLLVTTTPTLCRVLGKSASGTDNVQPAIFLGGPNGTNITNKTQNVVVGQQIVLYGFYNLPSGATFTSQSWTIPGTNSAPPTAISYYAYTVGSNSTTGGPRFLATTDLGQQSITYYFVAPANPLQVTFTLKYNANGTAQTATAPTTFNIAGPTLAQPNTPFATAALGNVAINPGPFLQFGGTSSNVGILFTASANQPAGYSWVFKWVNLISNDKVTMTDANGTQTSSLGTGFDVNPNGGYPSFPNVTPNTTNDNPKFQLVPPCTEIKRTFDAQTYLMWNAGLTNPVSIDIPLGSLTWGFSGDAILNSGTWTLNGTPTKYSTGFTNSPSYPAWSSGHFNGLGPACP